MRRGIAAEIRLGMNAAGGAHFRAGTYREAKRAVKRLYPGA